MSLIDARQLDPEAEIRTEICVVGAGAAGITLAGELVGTPHDVCLLEGGGFHPDGETQALYDLECAGYPVRENFMSRARYLGGSCNLWAGRSMKLEEADLARRDWVPATGWPIPYAELGAHYRRAADILGLPPLERFDWRSYTGKMSGVEHSLFSEEPLKPTVSLWAKRPMRFGAAFRSRLRRSRNVRLILYANVTNIVLNGDGTAVESLEARTLAGHRLTIRARTYVLACGALENARLLLVSRDRHATGVGNRFDLVGRYFMDHPRTVHGQVRLAPGCRLPLLRGHPLPGGKVQLGMGFSPHAQRTEGVLNHYATLEARFSQYVEASYQSFVQTMKVLLRRGYAGSRWDVGRGRFSDIPGMIYLLTPRELTPHFVYRWHYAFRNLVRRQAQGGTCMVVYFCEQPPDPESRVTLGADRDRLGMNKLVLHWRIGDEVTRSVLRLQEVLRRRLTAAGIGELESPDAEVRFTDASHHMGTTRMSDSPRTGVVDTDCRVHGLANLWVAGSSVFPSAGHANPTLTIVALALRLAELVKREARD
ncbi:MAG TPA: GMC family oxidoreductase [Gemmatimonadota bacterium]|nr:GMC family oxidoreductase [Gemmatimonadota bacterium]